MCAHLSYPSRSCVLKGAEQLPASEEKTCLPTCHELLDTVGVQGWHVVRPDQRSAAVSGLGWISSDRTEDCNTLVLAPARKPCLEGKWLRWKELLRRWKLP